MNEACSRITDRRHGTAMTATAAAAATALNSNNIND